MIDNRSRQHSALDRITRITTDRASRIAGRCGRPAPGLPVVWATVAEEATDVLGTTASAVRERLAG